MNDDVVSSADAGNVEADYIRWKDWQGEFGSLTSANSKYFENEIRGFYKGQRDYTVLEIGFGSGEFLRYCQDCALRVTGLEINQTLVMHGQAKGYDTRSADHLPMLPKASFDLIAAFDVLEHIDKENIAAFLRDVRSCLKPDGHILLRFPNGDSWLGRINQNGDPTHVSEIGYLMLDYFTKETGLTIVHYRSPKSAGFAAGFVRGVHAMIARPIAKIIAGFLHLIYFPSSPVVLSSPNVVAVLKIDAAGGQNQ